MHAYRDQYAQLFNNGQDVILIAVSADPIDALQSWAEDDQFQFLMASDNALTAARAYGSYSEQRSGVGGRNVFVIGPDGRIAWRATPFREVDPTSYEELGEAIRRLVPADTSGN